MSDSPSFCCEECGKKYPDQIKYKTHMKTKHHESMGMHFKNAKMWEQDLAELEDRIYVKFGELAETYSEGQNNQIQYGDDQHRFAGQANYLNNSIVRTPYENQIEFKKEVPFQFGKQHWEPLLNMLQEETLMLLEHLEKQRDLWEFLDPLEPEADPQNQFSLMDIGKLVKNYPKKQIKLAYPQFSIFILWIGRICKSQTWKTIYEVISCLICDYYDYLQKTKGSKCRKTWTKYFQEKEENQLHKIPEYQLTMNFSQLKENEIESIVNLYQKWVDFLSLIPKFQQKSVSLQKQQQEKQQQQKEKQKQKQQQREQLPPITKTQMNIKLE